MGMWLIRTMDATSWISIMPGWHVTGCVAAVSDGRASKRLVWSSCLVLVLGLVLTNPVNARDLSLVGWRLHAKGQ